MKRLVRLYPRAWRDRYGPELEALLEDEPTSAGVVVDVIAGAARAHGRAWEGRLRSPRVGPMLLLFGGEAWALLFIAGLALARSSYTDDLGLPVVAALGLLLAIGQLAIPRTDDRIASLGAAIGLVGAAIVVTSVVLRLAGGLGIGLDASLRPRGIWEQGMVLFLAGSAIGGVRVVMRSPSMTPRAAGAIVVGAAVVLAVALLDPLGGPVIIPMLSEAGQTGDGYQGFVGTSGSYVGGLAFSAAALLGAVLLITRTPTPRMRLVATVVLSSLLAVVAAVFLPWSSGRWFGVDAWSASGESGLLQLLTPPTGWFPTSDPVVVGGVLFGAAWAGIGWRRLREQMAIDRSISEEELEPAS